MSSNTLGKHFALTTFGESHGEAIGGIIDGCPAGIVLDMGAIERQLQRRRPGQSNWVSPRNEQDQLTVLSGVYEGKTLGSPLAFLIHNKDQRPSDYDNLKDVYRPGHADFVYEKKYGHRDPRGGGRSSARETAARVVAGSIAQQILHGLGVRITAYVSSIKDIHVSQPYTQLNLSGIDLSPVRCPEEQSSNRMIQLIEQVKNEGDSVGGIITCVAQGVPPGWGSPIYDKLNANLAHALFTLNAVKAFSMGDGYNTTLRKGSQNNDPVMGGSNHDGGITSGISNGKDIWFTVGFKPTSTLSMTQDTLNQQGEAVKLAAQGRHDPCVVIRAVPIVEALCAITLYNSYLQYQTEK